MDAEALKDFVVHVLEEGKGRDIQALDVRGNCDFADFIVIATGTATTHVKALGDALGREAKRRGRPPLGVEAPSDPEWVLIDLGDVVAHVMTERARSFYALEKLWSVKPVRAEAEAE